MKPLILVTAIACSVGFAPTAAHAALSDWGSWASSGYQFNITRPNVEWQTQWSVENNRITYNKFVDQGGIGIPWSGGEAYDIEGLYMDVIQKADGHTYLDWVLISSYSGLETPGDPNVAYYTGLRDGNSTSGWKYRQDPVIAIDLQGLSSEPQWNVKPAQINYQWALVLDSNKEACNDSSFSTAPADDSFVAKLYQVNDPKLWKEWVNSPNEEFPAAGPADLDTRTRANFGFVSADADSVSSVRYSSTKTETSPMSGRWSQVSPYNWIWEGSINIDSAITSGFTVASGKSSAIHYSMWCSNDYVYKPGGGFNVNNSPELSSGALLLLGMLPVGLGWLKRRRT